MVAWLNVRRKAGLTTHGEALGLEASASLPAAARCLALATGIRLAVRPHHPVIAASRLW